jgi:hypothetical protein
VRDFGQLVRVEVEGAASREAAWLNAAPGPAAQALSAEDLALGYQQLLHVERGWRDLTAHLELRP